ncbi:MAG: TlpA disulfide reductase family protein [Acidimicrobiia bacterium]|jgi:thiol-disulfide isomerase/thioredoxin
MATPKAPSKTQQRREAAARAAKRRRLVRAGLIAASIAIVAVVLVLAISAGSGGGTGVTDPDRFSLPRIQGDGQVELADYQGKPLVVNFFASWCTACDAELPGFSKVSKELRGEVQFVGVASLESGDPLFMPKRHDITWWPLARDIGGNQKSGLHDALGGGNSMPLTAFYDENGKLLGVDRAAIPEAALRQRLRDLYGVQV